MNIAMAAVMLLSSAVLLQQARAAVNQDNVMTKMADGTVIVNTTTLAKDVKGYSSATPLNIHIKNNKVVTVEALRNRETPEYLAVVKRQVLVKWEGKTVSKARKMKVDTTTGATLSGNAVVENVHRGLDYYTAHK
jgi:electron transport complex protein RnfG